ncbi:SCO2521 family protein [Cryptosporangium minutisporangium]
MSEIHTGLAQYPTSVPSRVARQALALQRVGESVRAFERPVPYVVSPDAFVGVDCRLVTSSGGRPRVVGAVASRASISGERILQSSAMVEVVRSESDRRRPWAYYLTRPGIVETIGKTRPDAIADGFLTAAAGSGLYLGGIAERLMDEVQRSLLREGQKLPAARRPRAIRGARTQLRWVLQLTEDGGEDRVAFGLQDGSLRVLRIRSSSLTPDQAGDFAAVVARHDWLLTALKTYVDRSRLDQGIDDQALAKLQPIVDHLLHLWMPTARLDDQLTPYWESLERASGFSRQWDTQVARIRDQLAMHTITLLRGLGSRAEPRAVGE